MDLRKQITEALSNSVAENLSGTCAGVLFSGGLDSGVIARLAGSVCTTRLYTVGLAGSQDLAAAEWAAGELGLPWTGIVLHEEDIPAGVAEVARLARTTNPVTVSFEMPLYFVARRASERLLVSGQGADELFGGYARYVGLSEEVLRRQMDQDLEALLTEGVARGRRIAARFGKVLFIPYLDDRVLSVARLVPPSERIANGVRKAVLREIALQLTLGGIALREKKAAQYGSGIMRAMESAARRSKMPLEQYVRHLANSRESP